MIAPLQPFAIRGAIWYQGESNAGRAFEYRKLFPTMIASWRASWGQGDFPFYFVQLANFRAVKEQPEESSWAELREAQSLTLGNSFNSGMAVIIDIGEAGNIHPKNKQDVGHRLALVALAKTYGEDAEYSGPVCESMKIEDGAIRLYFSHLGKDGLFSSPALKSSDGGPLKGFAICGPDRKFVWADAKIDGSGVVVSSPKVKDPIAVRYAWADNPVCNLVNAAGLPASPFRTDAFPISAQPGFSKK
jgi:sialate O-acetylesterase